MSNMPQLLICVISLTPNRTTVTSGIFPLLGADSAVHMSEELRGASRMIPRSMIWTTIINGLFGWIMVITFTFCIGPGNLDAILASPTGYPFMAVFQNSTGSTASATAMAVWVVLMSECSLPALVCFRLSGRGSSRFRERGIWSALAIEYH